MVSKDTIEHFPQPQRVVDEVYRVLRFKGLFVIWVPFMHPFHGNDLYRYSPLGLHLLLQDFEIISFDSPIWVFSVLGSAFIQILKRTRLGFMEIPIKRTCQSLDRLFSRGTRNISSFAEAYRVVAAKRESSIIC